MFVQIKNLSEKVVQNEVTKAEIDRLTEQEKENGLPVKENMRLYRLKKDGRNAIAQNKCLHPEPEIPAEVPTFENPSGTMTKKEAEELARESSFVKEFVPEDLIGAYMGH